MRGSTGQSNRETDIRVPCVGLHRNKGKGTRLVGLNGLKKRPVQGFVSLGRNRPNPVLPLISPFSLVSSSFSLADKATPHASPRLPLSYTQGLRVRVYLFLLLSLWVLGSGRQCARPSSDKRGPRVSGSRDPVWPWGIPCGPGVCGRAHACMCKSRAGRR